MCFSSDGELYVGLTNRGWSSLGDASYGIQRLTWTGETPFEIHHIEAKSDGFDIICTREVEQESVSLDSIEIDSYTYRLHQTYGSDEVDVQRCELDVELDSEDRTRLHVRVEPLRAGYVHEIRCAGIRDVSGESLLHPIGFYTLNRIPAE